MCSHLGLIARQYFLFAYICHYFSLIISSSQDIRPPTVWPSRQDEGLHHQQPFSSIQFFICECGCWGTGHKVWQRLQNGLQEGPFSFPSLGSRDQTQAISLGGKHLYLLTHLASHPGFFPFMHKGLPFPSMWLPTLVG